MLILNLAESHLLKIENQLRMHQILIKNINLFVLI